MDILQFRFSSRFLSDSFWSLFGNLISVFAGLAVVKIITKLVVSYDYGKASLVLGVIVLLNNLLVGPLLAIHMRVYFDFLERGMELWYSRVFDWILGVGGIIALLIYALVAYSYDSHGEHIFLNLIIPAGLLILAQPFMSVATNYLEAHRLYRRLALTNILPKIFQPLILLLLLTVAVSGAYAIILSQGLAIIALLIMVRFLNQREASTNKPANNWDEIIKLKSSFASFGVALPLGYLVHWILSTGDRYLIEHFMTVKDVGIYTMNYGFWSMPYLMLNGWLEILSRPHLYAKATKKEWQAVKQVLVWRTVFGLTVSVIGTAILYILSESIALIMLGEQYWFGWRLMMSIAIAHCFFVVGYSILPIFLAGKKPRTILLATSTAAISNIVCNLFLIPTYGIIGAGLSTLFSYVIWAAVLAVGAHLFIRDLMSQGAMGGGCVIK